MTMMQPQTFVAPHSSLSALFSLKDPTLHFYTWHVLCDLYCSLECLTLLCKQTTLSSLLYTLKSFCKKRSWCSSSLLFSKREEKLTQRSLLSLTRFCSCSLEKFMFRNSIWCFLLRHPRVSWCLLWIKCQELPSSCLSILLPVFTTITFPRILLSCVVVHGKGQVYSMMMTILVSFIEKSHRRLQWFPRDLKLLILLWCVLLWRRGQRLNHMSLSSFILRIRRTRFLLFWLLVCQMKYKREEKRGFLQKKDLSQRDLIWSSSCSLFFSHDSFSVFLRKMLSLLLVSCQGMLCLLFEIPWQLQSYLLPETGAASRFISLPRLLWWSFYSQIPLSLSLSLILYLSRHWLYFSSLQYHSIKMREISSSRNDFSSLDSLLVWEPVL